MSGPGAPDPSAADIPALYERYAAVFDRLRGDANFREAGWMARFRDLLPETPADILDLGCGMGVPVARFFIEAGHRVTGIDTAPSLIALCRPRFPAHDWQVADMRTLALGRAFDGVLAWNSFFHLTPDAQRGMGPVFAAHARPGAPLMFTSGPHAGEAIGTFEGDRLYHASLSPDDYRALLDQAGFDIVDFVPEDPTCGGLTVWLARKR